MMSSSSNGTDRRNFLKSLMATAMAAFAASAVGGTAEAGNTAVPADAGLSFKATEKFKAVFDGAGDTEYTALVVHAAKENIPMGQRYWSQVCGIDDRDLNKAWLHFHPRV